MRESKKIKAQLPEEIEALRATIRSQTDRLEAAMLQSSIVESAMDAIIVVDEAQNIAQFNAAAGQIFGYATADVIVAERIRSALEQMVFKSSDQADESNHESSREIRVTASIGVPCLLSQTDGLPGLLARADQTLYTAKQSGRNRVCVVTE